MSGGMEKEEDARTCTGTFHPDKALALADLREQLIRQEETIIFALIERAQFKRNPIIYAPGGLQPATTGTENVSFLDFFLRETEKVHSLMRRYTAPDEHAFFPEHLLKPVLSLLSYEQIIKPNTINFNQKLMSMYINSVLPLICNEGDDGQYGSAANCDINVLQAVSKRVHYGKFVAESKFQEDPDTYSRLIREQNAPAILALLTNEKVEQQVLRRVRAKSLTYGREIEGASQEGAPTYKVNADHIVSIYRDFLIPLTKEIEVEYLLQRVDHMCVAYLGPAGSYSHQAAVQYFQNDTTNVAYLPFADFGQVFQAVLSNQTSYGIIPIENSSAGRVHQSTSHFFATETANVCGETYLRVEHCFLCKTEDLGDNKHKNKKLDIKTIYSHPQALQQCDKWIKTNYPEAECVAVSSTSHAAALVSQSPKDGACAAIASALCADQYNNLSVAQSGIQDDAKNTTRFVVITKANSSGPTGKDKTMLVMAVPHKTGALAKALTILQENSINMCSIESYPQPAQAWAYAFFIELEGHIKDNNMAKALAQLQGTEITTQLRILGSFPARDPAVARL